MYVHGITLFLLLIIW